MVNASVACRDLKKRFDRRRNNVRTVCGLILQNTKRWLRRNYESLKKKGSTSVKRGKTCNR